jgi:hypothetical protein
MVIPSDCQPRGAIQKLTRWTRDRLEDRAERACKADEAARLRERETAPPPRHES